jgi:hypothetical protein
MKKATRKRQGLAEVSKKSFAALELALRGHDPALSPEWAADALRKSQRGRRLLVDIIRGKGAPDLRRAAVYGFVFGPATPGELDLLVGTFADPGEDPRIRAQAAEALAARIVFESRTDKISKRDAVARAALVRGLDDPAPLVRFWSIFALAQPGNDWVLEKLAMMKRDKTLIPGMWTIGQEAAWAISWIRGENLDREPRDF